MGIALQSWELHGWRDTLGQLYWFWRDRKGLVGAIVAVTAGLCVLQAPPRGGRAAWRARRGPRFSARASRVDVIEAFAFSMALQAIHMGMRIGFTARIYGWRFASAAPARVTIGNAINFCAAVCAIKRYVESKWTGQQMAWCEDGCTAYPTRAPPCRRGRVWTGGVKAGAD